MNSHEILIYKKLTGVRRSIVFTKLHLLGARHVETITAMILCSYKEYTYENYHYITGNGKLSLHL